MSSSPVPSATSTAARPTASGSRRARVARRDQDPPEPVGAEADSAGRRGHDEREAHERDVDPEPPRNAGGHAAEPAGVAVAPQHASGVRCAGRRRHAQIIAAGSSPTPAGSLPWRRTPLEPST